jgi:hypothetical protein
VRIERELGGDGDPFSIPVLQREVPAWHVRPAYAGNHGGGKLSAAERPAIVDAAVQKNDTIAHYLRRREIAEQADQEYNGQHDGKEPDGCRHDFGEVDQHRDPGSKKYSAAYGER